MPGTPSPEHHAMTCEHLLCTDLSVQRGRPAALALEKALYRLASDGAQPFPHLRSASGVITVHRAELITLQVSFNKEDHDYVQSMPHDSLLCSISCIFHSLFGFEV